MYYTELLAQIIVWGLAVLATLVAVFVALAVLGRIFDSIGGLLSGRPQARADDARRLEAEWRALGVEPGATAASTPQKGAASNSKELVSVEQVRRMLALLNCPYTRVEPTSPPRPDVLVTTPSARIAVETTEVHWGVGPKGGSPTRATEEQAIRAGVVTGGWVPTDPIPAIARAVDSKCRKSYLLDGDVDLWLALLGGSSAAPRSTSVFTVGLDLGRLSASTSERLTRSRFSRCYLFCELTERGPALYGWDRNSPWRQII